MIILCLIFCLNANADIHDDLTHLQQAYPGLFKISADDKYIIWNNGVKMPVGSHQLNKSFQEKLENPSLADQISDIHYLVGEIDLAAHFQEKNDPGRIRNEDFFKEMYGHTEQEVRTHLTTIDWMPQTFKEQNGHPIYQVQVTTINEVDKKLDSISHELDELVEKYPEYKNYLDIGKTGGTFQWRNIANTNRISNHSFGMTMDINPNAPYSSYWQYDLPKDAINDSQGHENSQLTYHENKVPWPIILVFEKYKFIWGGKWYHYDTMHFEYRPELFL